LKFVATLALLLSLLSPALADTKIITGASTEGKTVTMDPGGSIFQYADAYRKDRDANTKFIIDGPCISACTLITVFIKPENVCVTDAALFGFHSAGIAGPMGTEFSAEATRLIWHWYSPKIRNLLFEYGLENPGIEHFNLVYVPPTMIYERCTKEQLETHAEE
jgi:hypothetical protein